MLLLFFLSKVSLKSKALEILTFCLWALCSQQGLSLQSIFDKARVRDIKRGATQAAVKLC